MPKISIYDLVNKEIGIKDESNIIKKLTTPYKKDSSREPKHLAYEKNAIQQADILYLPKDPKDQGTNKKLSYVLSVVDVASRALDAEPILNKKSQSILEGFKKIYSRKYVKMPKIMIQVDNEFNTKEIKNYFHLNGVITKFGKPYRHRHQGLIEKILLIISKSIFNIQYSKEYVLGVENTEFLDDLHKIIKIMNKAYKRKNVKIPSEPIAHNDKDKQLLLKETRVRVPLEKPENIHGQKIGDKFRGTDLRRDKKIRKIDNIILQGGQPPMYTVEGIPQTAYTKNQLQLVGDEKPIKLPKKKKLKNIKVKDINLTEKSDLKDILMK